VKVSARQQLTLTVPSDVSIVKASGVHFLGLRSETELAHKLHCLHHHIVVKCTLPYRCDTRVTSPPSSVIKEYLYHLSALSLRGRYWGAVVACFGAPTQ